MGEEWDDGFYSLFSVLTLHGKGQIFQSFKQDLETWTYLSKGYSDQDWG